MTILKWISRRCGRSLRAICLPLIGRCALSWLHWDSPAKAPRVDGCAATQSHQGADRIEYSQPLRRRTGRESSKRVHDGEARLFVFRPRHFNELSIPDWQPQAGLEPVSPWSATAPPPTRFLTTAAGRYLCSRTLRLRMPPKPAKAPRSPARYRALVRRWRDPGWRGFQ